MKGRFKKKDLMLQKGYRISETAFKDFEKFCEKYQMQKSQAIRFCINYTLKNFKGK